MSAGLIEGSAMARRPLKRCAAAACSVLVRGVTYCDPHQREYEQRRSVQVKRTHKTYNDKRDASDDFYKQSKWRKLSVHYRRLHPLCAECEREGRATPSKMVDHIKPYKTHPALAYEWSNLRALCWACHNRIGERVGLVGATVHTSGEGA